MKAGFAERDITPAEGMERPGGYGKAFHKGPAHDPCKVRAAVFDDGTTRVALVGIDVLAVPRKLVVEARDGIAKQCGIRPEAVMIGASHTHSGGPTCMVQPGEFDHASDLVKKLAYGMSSCADAKYLELVKKALIEAVVEADQRRVEVRACVGSGRAEGVAFNRRQRMKNGLTYSHAGKGNPDILGYAGPTDPEVGVIGAWDLKEQFLGCVVNFACHGTAGVAGTSADWIYYLERTIRGVMGQDAIVVFLNGACGDVTQVDNLSPYTGEFGERAGIKIGQTVGAEALKVLANAMPGDIGPTAAKTDVLRIPRRKPSPDKVKAALETVAKDPKEVGHTVWTFAKETVLLDALLQKEPVAEVEVQAIQVGPVVFLANPAEFFCQLGLDIKKGSPFPLTCPVELANGCVGYVPTEEALGDHGGGYETRLTAYSNLEPRGGPTIVAACIALAKTLTPGSVPEPPKAPPFKKGWEYGTVPPETE
ncbi:MAG TPA: hypothetical protein PLE19_05600 [Planctomycetota bacterium]|nr:hypothetical protein [Planctomycetota bacterium]HRR80210.1 hypothetical protein [Planctomycetota bacterium]HRT93198.1 hypothetical protein [Planctomycetota bacterium]